jgi:uncharacterized repeat protein (TIGR04076 family)
MAGPNGIPVRLEITEILVGGECPVGHKVGDSWIVKDGIVPEGICAAAFNAMQPYLVAIRYGGAMPWSGEAKFSACCPDPANPVVFKMEAVPDEE